MLSERRVKIVATIGPSTSSRDGLEKDILSGMNVARLIGLPEGSAGILDRIGADRIFLDGLLSVWHP